MIGIVIGHIDRIATGRCDQSHQHNDSEGEKSHCTDLIAKKIMGCQLLNIELIMQVMSQLERLSAERGALSAER